MSDKTEKALKQLIKSQKSLIYAVKGCGKILPRSVAGNIEEAEDCIDQAKKLLKVES